MKLEKKEENAPQWLRKVSVPTALF